MANLLRRPRPSRLQLPQSSPTGGHRGGGGFQPLWNGQLGATGVPTINAHATRGDTADDVIRNQGGLSPGFGPTGINDLYSKTAVPGWQALQNEKDMASPPSRNNPNGGNNPGAADNMARIRQDKGLNLFNQAQGGRDINNQADMIGRAGAPSNWGDDLSLELPAADKGGSILPIHDALGGPPLGGAISPNAGHMGAPVSLDALRVAGGNPVGGGATFPGGTTLGIGSPQMLGAMGYADGGEEHDTPMATVAEKEPEYMFNNDGTMERFDKPTLLQGHKPGVIIPGHEITRLVARYRRPPKDVATVAFDDGGMMADNDDSGNGATPLAYKRGGSLMAGPKEKKPLMKVSGYDDGGVMDPRQSNARWTDTKSRLLNLLTDAAKKAGKTDELTSLLSYANKNRDSLSRYKILGLLNLKGNEDAAQVLGLKPNEEVGEKGLDVDSLLDALTQDTNLVNQGIKLSREGDVDTSRVPTRDQLPAFVPPQSRPLQIPKANPFAPLSQAAPAVIPAIAAPATPVFGGDDSTGENAPAPPESVLDSSGDGDVPVTPAKPALQQPGFRRSRMLHSWEEPGFTIADRAEAGRSAVTEGKALQGMGMSLRSHPTDSPIPSYADPNSQRMVADQLGVQPSVETEQNRLAVQRAHPPSKPFVDPQTGEITPLGQEAIETGGVAMSVPPPMPRGMKAYDKGGLMGGGPKKRKPLML